MDEDIVRWVLEFLLRQPIDDRILESLLSALPVPNSDSRLKKTLLLRRIESEASNGSVSEKILESLEIIEELDHREGKAASESMKEAYCMVAVDCTVRFLQENVEKNGKYFEAVKRIWGNKVTQMEKLGDNAGGLVSETLLRWRDEIEGAIWDSNVRDKILMRNTMNAALKAVRAYLSEAWKGMGSSFLELAAQAMSKMGNDGQVAVGEDIVGVQFGERVENPVNACRRLADIDNTRLDHGSIGGIEGGGHQGLTVNEPAESETEAQKGKCQLRRKHAALHGRRFKSVVGRSRGVKVTNTCEVDKDMCMDMNHLLPTPEVNRLQEALKSSSMELHNAVSDPLLDALCIAETVSSGMERDRGKNAAAVVNPSRIEVQVSTAPSKNAAVYSWKKEYTVNEIEGTKDNFHGKHGGYLNCSARVSLMDRNPTAHTFSWDDSIENTRRSPNRPQVPSPNRDTVGPLKDNQHAEFMRRKKRKRWSPVEEDTLRTGVQKYGKGSWKLILNAYLNVFAERTEVDLKDKWRNMTRYSG
ncbi:hypothetical protein Nepgr_001787 [Nepenthes gracilis]|uniref:Uncharacterized protein n=1 Tax=Nepenthes gracilis TaxID=150966 RepID=A0AAD3P7T4_NEPGR|nr:hypothetical protein Nepgr_001787 [Nepenthes gracilis]